MNNHLNEFLRLFYNQALKSIPTMPSNILLRTLERACLDMATGEAYIQFLQEGTDGFEQTFTDKIKESIAETEKMIKMYALLREKASAEILRRLNSSNNEQPKKEITSPKEDRFEVMLKGAIEEFIPKTTKDEEE